MKTQARLIQVVVLALLLTVVSTLVGPDRASAASYKFERNVVTKHKWVSANGYCEWNPDPIQQVGVGCWRSDGDRIGVGDTKKDGLRAGVQWQTDYGRKGLCIQPHGQDTVITTPDGQGLHYWCDKNMKEGKHIRIRVGACNGSKVNCNVLANWKRWSGWSRWMKI